MSRAPGRRAALIFTLALITASLVLVDDMWPYNAAAHWFDWDRYHAREDACAEADRIAMVCTRDVEYCDERLLRQAQRCSPFSPQQGLR